jgi:butyrate kinase
MNAVLAVNPGSTTTKAAVFEGERLVSGCTLRHADEELRAFAGRPILHQLELRLAALTAEYGSGGYAAVVGRGGLLAPLPGGTYAVDDDMLAELEAAPRGEHASNLGAFLAHRLARRAGCPAYIVDPVSVDEWEPVARYSGLAGIERESLSHALNTRAVARRHAALAGVRYDALRLVVIHLGSGVTVSAHHGGRMVDACNSMDEGPFAMDRAGGVPVRRLLDLAFSADTPAARSALRHRLFGAGGVYSYLGTRDLPAVLERIDAGDGEAAAVLAALLYQVAKEAGAMAAVLEGRVDAVLVTGGMAHAHRVAEAVRRGAGWIAPVHVYPGEDELRALAEGAQRVLAGLEPALRYTGSRLRTR